MTMKKSYRVLMGLLLTMVFYGGLFANPTVQTTEAEKTEAVGQAAEGYGGGGFIGVGSLSEAYNLVVQNMTYQDARSANATASLTEAEKTEAVGQAAEGYGGGGFIGVGSLSEAHNLVVQNMTYQDARSADATASLMEAEKTEIVGQAAEGYGGGGFIGVGSLSEAYNLVVQNMSFQEAKSAQVARQGIRKVLMIPREGYSSDMDLVIKMEVGEMKRVLKEAGFAVDIATTSGQPILGVTQYIYGVSKLSEINLSDYAGIIMPCMSVGRLPGPPVSPEVVLAVKNVLAEGKPVAAASGSAIILAEAGVLKGRKYAFFINPLDPIMLARWHAEADHRFDDAIYSGRGVVKDGKIITCGSNPYLEHSYAVPSGTVELTQTFIAALGTK